MFRPHNHSKNTAIKLTRISWLLAFTEDNLVFWISPEHTARCGEAEEKTEGMHMSSTFQIKNSADLPLFELCSHDAEYRK